MIDGAEFIPLIRNLLRVELERTEGELASAYRHALAGTGKMIRPQVVGQIVLRRQGLERHHLDLFARAAAGLEMIHLASLVHDDIIDSADMRRQMNSVRKEFGDNSALLVGDTLLAGGLGLALDGLVDAVPLLVKAIAKLCEGQATELALQDNPSRPLTKYQKAIHGKTVVMFTVAGEISLLDVPGLPNITAGTKGAVAATLSHYGTAFQWLDDIRDMLSGISWDKGTSDRCGDLLEGVYTLPLLLALADHIEPVIEALHRLRRAIELKGATSNLTKSVSLALWRSGYLDKALDQVAGVLDDARRSVGSSRVEQELPGFADYIFSLCEESWRTVEVEYLEYKRLHS